MQYFPQLPVLDYLLAETDSKREAYIVSVQHLLSSTGSLFEAILRLGIKPANIYLLGKIYSTHSETEQKLSCLGINVAKASSPAIPGTYTETLEADVKRLWQNAARRVPNNSLIIILDDGGYVIKNFPVHEFKNSKVIGIEQTMSGIKLINRNFKHLPVISVAGSAAKTIIEPPIVSEAVNIRLGKVIRELNPARIGIIGYGNIGFAVAKQLSKQYTVEVFEKSERLLLKKLNGIHYSSDLLSTFSNCDLIIGATGEDVSINYYKQWLENIDIDKTLISISSGDIEFKTLLQNSKNQLLPVTSALQTLEIVTSNRRKIKVLRGGMVANFTGEADSSPAHIIQLTRGLLLAAIIQVLDKYNELVNYKDVIMLSAALQKKVVSAWFKDQPQRKTDYSKEIIEGFDDDTWITNHSEGTQI